LLQETSKFISFSPS